MTIQDGQVKWKIKDVRTHHMCGEIVALVTTPPDYEHLLLCNGQTINADDYPELVAALGTNVLPNLNGRVLQGAETAGEYKEAGLPNISGSFDIRGWTNGTMVHDSTGAMRIIGEIGDDAYTANQATTLRQEDRINFDASRSNNIYGNATTVQPPAYTVRYYICYG